MTYSPAGPKLPIGVVEPITRLMYRAMLHPSLPLSLQRAAADRALDIEPLPRDTVVRTLTLGGRPTERVTVGASETDRAVLFLHGGGYTLGSPHSHRHLAAHLASVTGAALYLIDYRLAPEDPYPAAVDDAVAAFRDLVDNHGFSPATIAVAGDSAGGGLSVATARRLVDDHDLRPAALGLISPWVDPGDDSHETWSTDSVVNRRWSRFCAAAYLADGDPTDPGYAPLHGILTGLPPTVVHIGEREALYQQVIRFTEKLRASDVEVDLMEFPRLWHVGHQQAGMLREAADAVDHIGGFLRSHLA
ncbi:alpha/beta hydrolase [Williamsia phyllosphaerae]|uniref:Acetylesterase n=1 Tax=Williamsia phyllosphaerae TaxID=885042 RepID=A0ABQ1V1Q3_9NOCA|nr:alpha/beta hydrolase [Williamsia phyllosphaerae]GGF30956.1 acetylesterase [Williamsia phyllosphaerae]